MVYERPSVRTSVCLSHHLTAAAACGGFAAERPAGSIDRQRRAAGAQQQRRRSMALTSSKCGQFHIDSRVNEAGQRLVFRASANYTLQLFVCFVEPRAGKRA